jgi:hypothetical protein
MVEKGSHQAVGVGASLTGLQAAPVLADRFDHGTVIERDVLPEAPASRKKYLQDATLMLGPGWPAGSSDLFPGLSSLTLGDIAIHDMKVGGV